ncbi:hypothetical protein WBG78_10625 [Chryseolinea sp. T2]|uniref:hypothetical protein n=1 Tax=Chryseolinea sp. T2 TaxID=3129255 RepID=UPI003077C10D
MPSILPGFEYDIFISYRHNDNKYDQWVSDFVHNLRLELVATLKDRLSIYFDENPEDGIRDIHNVDKSLASKLNALIFIPIISNTYCDTSSFAWRQEFLPFKSLAANGELGPDVTLTNGNVASRMLPVRIHEIDVEDTRLLERELNGALRTIDFIYKSAGVNRPLRQKDDGLLDNQSGTLYRNQINKVANAIKDLIVSLKRGSGPNPTLSLPIRPFSTASISASVPETIRYAVSNGNRTTVYLAWTSFELKAKREEMLITLQKAGFDVVPTIDCPSDEDAFRDKVREYMEKSKCSLHILGNEYGRRFEADDSMSFPAFQFEEARKKSESEMGFQTFIWFSPEARETLMGAQSGEAMKPAQATFINHIRNNITRDMVFSNSTGPMQLVEDMRAITVQKEVPQLDTKDTDIFFIFNQQDEQDAELITDLISNVYPIETMNILPDSEEAYRELSKQQIPKSRLAVVYFKYAADWAIPFAKQIWKQIGGASSPTPIMLIGEDDPRSNIARTFKAPKVVSSIVPKQDVPEEVKRVYVKVVQP